MGARCRAEDGSTLRYFFWRVAFSFSAGSAEAVAARVPGGAAATIVGLVAAKLAANWFEPLRSDSENAWISAAPIPTPNGRILVSRPRRGSRARDQVQGTGHLVGR